MVRVEYFLALVSVLIIAGSASASGNPTPTKVACCPNYDAVRLVIRCAAPKPEDFKCSSDIECKTGLICCETACRGRECTAVSKPAPDYKKPVQGCCPNRDEERTWVKCEMALPDDPRHQCGKDADCKNGLRCCETACRIRQCTVVSQQTPEAPVYAPVLIPIIPIPVTVSPNTMVCPLFAESCSTTQYVTGCSSDRDCRRRGEVCCQLSCTRRQCMKPVCKYVALNPTGCFIPGHLQCTREGNCRLGSHCCTADLCGDSACIGRRARKCPASQPLDVTCSSVQSCGNNQLRCRCTDFWQSYCY